MTSRINAKSSQNGHAPATAAKVTQPPQTNSYSPAVPISIYRQVATELQSTQTVLEALKTQNQQLTEQNQQLRLEIERVVQSALQLRQVADAHHPRPATPTSESTRSELELHFVSAPAASPPARANEPTAPTEPIAPKPVVEQESQPQRTRSTERSPEVGGWWLVLIILLIVVTAFGTGFLIVRPLLPNR